MPEFTTYTVFFIFGIALLSLIAFPEMMIKVFTRKKLKFGSTYWGFYDGAPADEPEEEKTIECQEPAPSKKDAIGSHTYALGRGVRMR